MKSLNKAAILATLATVLTAPAMAAIDISTEATAFQTDFTSVAATMGATFLAAGFAGIVWKWARGMLFG